MAHFIEARVELFVSRGAAEHVSTHGHTLQPREAQAEPQGHVETRGNTWQRLKAENGRRSRTFKDVKDKDKIGQVKATSSKV